MKKTHILAIALVIAAGAATVASCSNSKKAETGDTTETQAVAPAETAETQPETIAEQAEAQNGAATETPADSQNGAVVSNPDLSVLAATFKDPSKRSKTATASTYAVTPSGLKYMILKTGNGKRPTATSEVTVHYTGELLNGEVFDSSVSRGETATFPLNRVIPGWTEGLQLMREGGKAVFYIPSNLAYGPAGAPPIIGPNEDLIFTVELFSVGE